MKTQMKFQKILSLVTLILAALCIVLSLCYCSGVMSEIINYTSSKMTTEPDIISADALFEYSQYVNDVLVILSIVFILVVAFIYITATNKRRNYYITNYIAIGLLIAYVLAFAIVMLVLCVKTNGYVNQVDFTKWKELYEAYTTDRYGNVSYINPRRYSESRATIILGIILSIILIVDVAAWALNLIMKIKLMQGEKALLANGVEVNTLEVA